MWVTEAVVRSEGGTEEIGSVDGGRAGIFLQGSERDSRGSHQYRWVLRPILEYVLEVERQNPSRQIVVVLPEMVERHWYYYLLHNQRAEILKTWMLLRGSQRIIVVNVPWYLKA